mmetsp:Transcript_22561/g.57316  ORF Transcript_22561/g.57316 Transcript_22561/m.57316 type:complete len:259 (-) Transcript_22561:357-1133(-)|eukprot:CAMPEP_0202868408 /NCGR_PEP_ID=MMETSP1391-20130828/10865_1 /ASSEMBLY_ACC=CAM_ASM_000867 /TAXON_ID=1034604 /ORGANISM="Chlamydomonas leiostraca, Strain SAG 11-49" /LENGTH=258 /DNA_ID=CAMNT_0049548581 /DNA_START=121 /DNA_END=897 /DNA_ORIENTATION=+
MATTNTEQIANLSDETQMLHELGIKAPPKSMLDVHKNPLLISILDGVDTLRTMASSGEIPVEYLQASKGLLIMKTDKIGFGLSVTQGYGLVMARATNRPSGWSAPLPVKVDGFSVGAVMGFSEQHTVICLATDDEINNFKLDKRAMKIGLEMALNVKNPMNDQELNKDLALDTTNTQIGETGLKTKAFTISKGMMVDMSLKGTSVEPDAEDINNCYGSQVTPADILNGSVSPPREATLLYNTIRDIVNKHSAPVPAAQ